MEKLCQKDVDLLDRSDDTTRLGNDGHGPSSRSSPSSLLCHGGIDCQPCLPYCGTWISCPPIIVGATGFHTFFHTFEKPAEKKSTRNIR
jgi:hypothetical protein